MASKAWPVFEVGDYVFVSGRSARVVAAHGDGSYTVEYADSQRSTAWAFNMAFRGR